MSITPVNLTKHSITPNNKSKGGYVMWDDDVITWDSAIGRWDSPYSPITNLAKHTITPVNLIKN
jgi:hypothetical protein